MNNNVIAPVELMNKILNYLAKRPYGEVYQLISEIQRLRLMLEDNEIKNKGEE